MRMMYFESTPSCDLSSNPPKEKYQGEVAIQGVAEMDTPLMGDICITICSSFIIIAKDVL